MNGFDELGAPGTATHFEPISVTDESTVVATYIPEGGDGDGHQSEAELENAFIAQLIAQAYERLVITKAADLENNLRTQLERLNKIQFTDAEWKKFFIEKVASKADGIVEKTTKIQEDHVQVLTRDDGTVKNIALIDKTNIHNNGVQVVNQYEVDGAAAGAKRANRYDVTILVNGLPLVHVELKRRGVAVKEAFNQIDRYQRESFWSDSGLFEYVQLFVISNGRHTKYYANTTRERRIKEATGGKRGKNQTSNTFEFTSWWTDADNKRIGDLTAFTKTFFAKHTLLNILTKYCVFDVGRTLLVMRPYQIVASERILQRIVTSTSYKQYGTVAGGGYIWHTTGSGKTLTSFKTAQLSSRLPGVDKVLFVVDRKDLDYQTIREYERFEKGAVDGTNNTAHLKKRLEDPDSKIIVTTIQKLARFIEQNKGHEIYAGHLVIIFDECHRSQFGDMGTAIRKAFKKFHMFGFTGTPIFADNAGSSGGAARTTEQLFGDRLHTYTIVDAINDGNVLPFKVAYQNTVKVADHVSDKEVEAINTEEVLMHPDRIEDITGYVLDHFDTKTKRSSAYTVGDKRVRGFNSMFAVSSIPAVKLYYDEFAKQQKQRAEQNPGHQPLKVATIFSYAANEEAGGILGEEGFDTGNLDASSRDFLERAIADYNAMFGTSYDTSAKKFENYYKDLARRLKDREVDLVIVVNMFLTGFDATTLNTLWVDKNLRQHGLIQAFSRTNRILNSVKAYGNIICFRNLEENVDDALALFGNKEARGIVLLKSYDEYYSAYEGLANDLLSEFPVDEDPLGEEAEKRFIKMFGAILRLRNILTSFDEFEGNTLLTPRQLQDYQSIYLNLHDKHRSKETPEKESILDDVVFEIELIKQVEVNIDYILLLVQKWREAKGNGSDKEMEALVNIQNAIDSSPSLRNKRDLVMAFLDSITVSDTTEDWSKFIAERREKELAELIAEEKLKESETRAYVANAFRDGALSTTGTAITQILPPVSRFSAGGEHGARKLRVIEKLTEFFERYFGLG
ncbi:type I restriction endonuclease subunit R [Nocardioides jejuensis]|uniref:Type I restriction enzyme endonuclease subunit n=1 Tax=Nocardioides jejuensis TaxID=2502782 RepID=A0A4R1CIA4_9ACTN|nr:type I restriction endonuclease subunit R [Nocardioides jejuensis]TCJ31050.1 type I restriction endonuclease subunit R [Nocardioides jejuensis]